MYLRGAAARPPDPLRLGGGRAAGPVSAGVAPAGGYKRGDARIDDDRIIDPDPPGRLAPAPARRRRAGRGAAAHSARQFARAIVMPNLKPPVTTAAAGARLPRTHPRRAAAGQRFRAADDAVPDRPHSGRRDPPRARGRRRGAASCTRPARRRTATPASPTSGTVYAALEAMQREGLLLLVHGEVTDADIDMFDREAVFIERVLEPLRRDFPELKVVFEHITTREAAALRRATPGRTWPRPSPRTTCCTTATRSSPAGCGPHYYCLPVLKRETHRRGAGRGRHLGHRRSSSSAPTARRTPPQLKEHASRLRRLLHRAVGAGAVRRGLRRRRRARQAGRLRQLPRRRLLRPAAQPRPHHAAPARLDAARDRCRSARRRSSRCAAATRYPGNL